MVPSKAEGVVEGQGRGPGARRAPGRLWFADNLLDLNRAGNLSRARAVVPTGILRNNSVDSKNLVEQERAGILRRPLAPQLHGSGTALHAHLAPLTVDGESADSCEGQKRRSPTSLHDDQTYCQRPIPTKYEEIR